MEIRCCIPDDCYTQDEERLKKQYEDKCRSSGENGTSKTSAQIKSDDPTSGSSVNQHQQQQQAENGSESTTSTKTSFDQRQSSVEDNTAVG